MTTDMPDLSIIPNASYVGIPPFSYLVSMAQGLGSVILSRTCHQSTFYQEFQNLLILFSLIPTYCQEKYLFVNSAVPPSTVPRSMNPNVMHHVAAILQKVVEPIIVSTSIKILLSLL